MDPATVVIFAGLVIGLTYGAIGLVSGFCLMSSLRGWWADGDGRLVRTYALAMGTGVAAPSFSPHTIWSISASRSICSRHFPHR